jgi:hypothetical protein
MEVEEIYAICVEHSLDRLAMSTVCRRAYFVCYLAVRRGCGYETATDLRTFGGYDDGFVAGRDKPAFNLPKDLFRAAA